MTTTAQPEIILDENKSEDRRVAFGTLVGTAVEWYDFFIYANAAAIFLGPLFFDPFVESSGELAGRLVSFATVGISFFFRTLGVAVAGHCGDKLGRKVMLVATLMLMGSATFLIGVLPPTRRSASGLPPCHSFCVSRRASLPAANGEGLRLWRLSTHRRRSAACSVVFRRLVFLSACSWQPSPPGLLMPSPPKRSLCREVGVSRSCSRSFSL